MNTELTAEFEFLEMMKHRTSVLVVLKVLIFIPAMSHAKSTKLSHAHW